LEIAKAHFVATRSIKHNKVLIPESKNFGWLKG